MVNMKDSGIEWLGKIPESWGLSRIGSVYELRNTKVSDKDYPPLSVTNKGIVPQLETAAKTNAHDDRKLVKKGDFAINSRSDRRGSCGISSYEGSISLINTILAPLGEMNPRYYDWLFHTLQFSDEFYKWGHGIVDDLWTTNWQDMKKITIPMPALAEQEKIATFLDIKCSEIDALAADIQAEIDILEEYKRSVIMEKVTKGVELDVEMKDSGIEWAGEIPHDWDIIKIKYATIEIKKGISPDYTEAEKTKIINQATFSKGFFDIENIRYANDDFNKSRGKVQRNDVLLATTGGGVLGKTYYFDEEGEFLASTDVAYLRVDTSILMAKFLYYCMTINYIMFNDIMANGSTNQTHFDMPSLFNMFIPLPNKKTQNVIIDYLDKKCLDIENIVAKKKQQLEILNQYKKSTIYEYVTGKKEVV
ncbi:MAG: restriction endonuclease subunit S [Roseburia sp.]|nr:restriction endonuclease subunit S [Roseburia sp.]